MSIVFDHFVIDVLDYCSMYFASVVPLVSIVSLLSFLFVVLFVFIVFVSIPFVFIVFVESVCWVGVGDLCP